MKILLIFLFAHVHQFGFANPNPCTPSGKQFRQVRGAASQDSPSPPASVQAKWDEQDQATGLSISVFLLDSLYNDRPRQQALDFIEQELRSKRNFKYSKYHKDKISNQLWISKILTRITTGSSEEQESKLQSFNRYLLSALNSGRQANSEFLSDMREFLIEVAESGQLQDLNDKCFPADPMRKPLKIQKVVMGKDICVCSGAKRYCAKTLREAKAACRTPSPAANHFPCTSC